MLPVPFPDALVLNRIAFFDMAQPPIESLSAVFDRFLEFLGIVGFQSAQPLFF